MGKFYGEIGYAISAQTSPGVWEDTIVKRNYFGDILRNFSRQTETPDSTNDDLIIDNQFSIVADQFAYQNFYSMKYVEYLGVKWKIKSVEVKHPRLILNVGGVYNGE